MSTYLADEGDIVSDTIIDLADGHAEGQPPDGIMGSELPDDNTHDQELEVVYPEDPQDDAQDDLSEEAQREVDDLIAEALKRKASAAAQVGAPAGPDGYVSNARNAAATSDSFTFWAPPENGKLGIGSIVEHESSASGLPDIRTYGIVVESKGQTLGLDDVAVNAYENDSLPPVTSIIPSPSRRRPIALWGAKVLSSTAPTIRPVLSGPIRALKGPDLLKAQGRTSGQPRDKQWLEHQGMVLGFYDDGQGDFGVFAEERARVLGPKQGHIVFSGVPGAGKTSLFLTLLIALFAQLRRCLQAEHTVATTAAIAFNVKGADLLFLDHASTSSGEPVDKAMWDLVGVDQTLRPFGRVVVLTPLAEDGFNKHTLRNDPQADVQGYSETRAFALGIEELWPHLDLLFDTRSSSATNLLAEIRLYFESSRTSGSTAHFTLAQVLAFFENTLLRADQRAHSQWDSYHPNTIRSVYQRLRALGATLGGLIDVTGTGFGLDILHDLQPFDLIVVDVERIMADPPDPELADTMLKIVTRHVLQRVTEAVTRTRCAVEHVIVFADELNRLAPARGESGVGEYLAHLARTTRDRGVILFGAGQFRSGINQDILKAAAVHYSMQTPEYELDDAIYKPLTGEFRNRLIGLQPGETLLQFPSLRKPVFARFPKPFLLTGNEGPHAFPPAPPTPLARCIMERLQDLDSEHPVREDEVAQLVDQVIQTNPQGGASTSAALQDLRRLLRDVEMTWKPGQEGAQTAWEQFRALVQVRYGSGSAGHDDSSAGALPPAAYIDGWDDSSDI